MSPRGGYDEDDLTDDDKDLPQEQDLADEDDESEEMVCPSCRATVAEDSQKCPHCGDWITPQHPSSHGWKRWLFVAAVLLMLWAMLRWMRLL